MIAAAARRPAAILLVEDNAADRRLIQELVAEAEADLFTFVVADNLAAARDLLGRQCIDAALLDLGLPDSVGLETFTALRTTAPHLPIVVLSGLENDETARRAVSLGAQDYLLKRELTGRVIVKALTYAMERANIETAMREREEHFRTIADFTGDWEYWIGTDRHVIYTSPSCERITGYAPQEFYRDKDLFAKIIHPADREAFVRHLQAAYEKAAENLLAPHELEFRIITRSGEERWIGHVCQAVFGKNGEAQGRRISNRDITDRKRSERERDLLHDAVSVSLTELYLFDAETLRCRFANLGALQNLGYTLAQIQGQPLEMICPELPAEVFRRSTMPLMDGIQAKVVLETHHRRADGVRYPVELRIQLIDSGGERVFLLAADDITAAKAAQVSLLANEERLESLLRISHYPARSVRELLDFALQEAVDLTGSRLGSLFLYDEERRRLSLHSRSQEVLRECTVTGASSVFDLDESGIFGEAVRRRRPLIVNDCAAPHPLRKDLPAGHVPLTRWLSIPLLHEDRVVAMVVVANKTEAYDDTDVRQLQLLMEGVWRIKAEQEAVQEVRRLNAVLEERVRERTARLEDSNRELESFSYSVSHDLRAPLRALEGFSEALLEDCGDRLDGAAKDYLGRIRAASLRMAELIDDLLQLSRISRHELHREDVDLSTLARDILNELARADTGRQVECLVQEGLTAQADPHLLGIVLHNLLGNAWKFTSREAHPRIEFGARLGGARLEFFVRDNGAGFDMAYVGKLFTPFQRLHTASEFPGTGIGLATVQRIIRRHGGEIRAEGRPDAGATFSFTL